MVWLSDSLPFSNAGVTVHVGYDLVEYTEMGREWYVLQVKPRAEKKTVRYLVEYGCWRHLPLYTKVTRVQRRKVRRQLPLFPGYVFSRLDPDERYKMLQTNLVIKTIRVTRAREMIHQLRQVARVSKNTTQLKALSQTFHEGEMVRVVSGPMRGTEGVVKYSEGRTSICLNVEILGAAVEVSIAPDEIEKI